MVANEAATLRALSALGTKTGVGDAALPAAIVATDEAVLNAILSKADTSEYAAVLDESLRGFSTALAAPLHSAAAAQEELALMSPLVSAAAASNQVGQAFSSLMAQGGQPKSACVGELAPAHVLENLYTAAGQAGSSQDPCQLWLLSVLAPCLFSPTLFPSSPLSLVLP